MGELGASCFHTLSEQERDIAKPAWDAERFGMVCTDSKNFADWKAAILKLCRISQLCTFEDKAMIEKLARQFKRFEK